MGLLEHIRSQKRETRGRYALLLAAGITMAIALIWVSTIPARMSGESVSIEKETQPFAFDDIIGDVQDQMANTIGSMKEPDPIETSNMDALSFGEDGGYVEEEEATTAPKVEEPVTIAATSTDSTRVYETPEPKVILIGTTTARTSSE